MPGAPTSHSLDCTLTLSFAMVVIGCVCEALAAVVIILTLILQCFPCSNHFIIPSYVRDLNLMYILMCCYRIVCRTLVYNDSGMPSI